MQSPRYPEPIPDETIANIVHQYLVTDASATGSTPNNGGNSRSSRTSPGQAAIEGSPEEIPVPYHLPGTAITHDIYTHANSLLASTAGSTLQRSKSTNNLHVQGGKIVHDDMVNEDPVLENLGKPGGFRRYYVQQQQQAKQAAAGGDQDNSKNDGYGQLLFRPASSSSSSETNTFTDYSALFRSDSLAQATTIGSLRGVQTRHFLEYLAITSVLDHFAGENLSESDEESGVDEEGEPLLHHKKQRSKSKHRILGQHRPEPSTVEAAKSKQKANALKTAFLLFKAFISSGILFLPKAFSNGGLGFSIVVLYFMGIVSLYCFLLLLDCKKHLSGSYGDIGGALYGPWMRHLVLFSIAISQLGFVCGGTIFIVENIMQAVGSLSHHTIQLSSTTVLVTIALFLMPLVLIRNIAKLSPAALFADVLIVTGLSILLVCDVYQIFSRKDDSPSVGPNIHWWFNPESYPVFIGTAVYSFEGIGLIIPIQDAMEKPERFPVVLTVVMALVATVLCTIGSFGYLAFGSEVKTVALLNLPDGPFSSIVQLGYALAVHLTNPLALFPTIRIVEHGLFGERTGKHNITIKWQKNALRCGIVVLGAFIAWGGANDLDKFISLIGSICCCPLSLIFPPLFHLHLPNTGGFQRRIDQGLVFFGIAVMMFTLWNTAQQWGTSS